MQYKLIIGNNNEQLGYSIIFINIGYKLKETNVNICYIYDSSG